MKKYILTLLLGLFILPCMRAQKKQSDDTNVYNMLEGKYICNLSYYDGCECRDYESCELILSKHGRFTFSFFWKYGNNRKEGKWIISDQNRKIILNPTAKGEKRHRQKYVNKGKQWSREMRVLSKDSLIFRLGGKMILVRESPGDSLRREQDRLLFRRQQDSLSDAFFGAFVFREKRSRSSLNPNGDTSYFWQCDSLVLNADSTFYYERVENDLYGFPFSEEDCSGYWKGSLKNTLHIYSNRDKHIYTYIVNEIRGEELVFKILDSNSISILVIVRDKNNVLTQEERVYHRVNSDFHYRKECSERMKKNIKK